MAPRTATTDAIEAVLKDRLQAATLAYGYARARLDEANAPSHRGYPQPVNVAERVLAEHNWLDKLATVREALEALDAVQEVLDR